MSVGPAVEADYVIIGAGGMGMAFADVILTESEATVAIVDARGRPGGHWNDAYPFVRLHQPSAFYGVNSRPLGNNVKDQVGWNQGLHELASGPEVCAYFDQVMNEQFLPSGRVQYLPLSHYRDGTATAALTGVERPVKAGKVVDATYQNVTVPAMAAPSYEVADGARCVPVNALGSLTEPAAGYVIIGGGKTAMDACLWLLANDVDPDAITWIMPRDSWLLDRANIQPGSEFLDRTLGGTARSYEVVADAASIDEMFVALEAEGQLLRIDPAVRPTMYRCATITTAELAQLRRINNVIRLGRVQRIETDRIILDEGSIPTTADHLHVDCSADGLQRRPAVPIFDGERLALQPVRTCQQVFSAAFCAHAELTFDDDRTKNEICAVVPHPDTEIDWLRSTLANLINSARWAADPDLKQWLVDARLDGFSQIRRPAEGSVNREHLVMVKRMMAAAPGAAERLMHLLAEYDAATG